MAARPQDMSAVKSVDVADAVASAIHDMAETMPISSSRDASVRRMLRKHAREIVGLHDDLDADEIFAHRKRTAQPSEDGALRELRRVDEG